MVGVLDLSSPAPVMVSAPTVTTRAATTESMILIIGLPLSVVEPARCITAVPCLRCDRRHKLLDFWPKQSLFICCSIGKVRIRNIMPIATNYSISIFSFRVARERRINQAPGNAGVRLQNNGHLADNRVPAFDRVQLRPPPPCWTACLYL